MEEEWIKARVAGGGRRPERRCGRGGSVRVPRGLTARYDALLMMDILLLVLIIFP